MNNGRYWVLAFVIILCIFLLSCSNKRVVRELSNETELCVGIRKNRIEKLEDSIQYKIAAKLQKAIEENSRNDKKISLKVVLYDDDGFNLIDNNQVDVLFDIIYEYEIEKKYSVSFPYDYLYLYAISSGNNTPSILENFDQKNVFISDAVSPIELEYLESLKDISENISSDYNIVSLDTHIMELLKLNNNRYLIGHLNDLKKLLNKDDDFNLYKIKSKDPEKIVSITKKNLNELISLVNRCILE